MFTYCFTDEIVCFLGANAALFDYTSIYIKYYVSFDIFFALSLALATFARNDGAPRLAFWAMIAGAVSNIFLDWLLIFGLHLGIKGAAVATGIGQIISCLILLPHFVRGKGELEFSFRYIMPAEIRQIIHTGLPECITQMSSPVTIFCYNLIIIEIFGEKGVAAYAIVSYLLLVVFAIFIGIAEALQPLLSRSYGEKNKIALTEFFKIGLKTNSFFAVIVYLFFLLFGKNIISIFTGDSNVIDLTYACICIYGISFMLAAFNIIYSTFFLATKKTDLAVKVAVLRGLIFNSICIFSVAWIFGQSGVWFGIVLAELLVLMYLYRQRLLKIPLTEL